MNKYVLAGILLVLVGCAGSRRGGVEEFVVFTADAHVHEAVTERADLEHVRLDGEGITNSALSVLGRVERLRRLWVTDTDITDEGLKWLRDHSSLTVLYLSEADIGDEGISNLGILPQLQALDISGTRVTNQVIKILQQFPSLNLVLIDDTSVDRDALNKAFEESRGKGVGGEKGRGKGVGSH